MSTTSLDPVERLLDKAEQGNLIIKKPKRVTARLYSRTNFT